MTLKEARERKGLSKTEAADKIGVHCTSITNWEEKGSIPRKSLREEICKAYEVTEDQIDIFSTPESPDNRKDDEDEIVNAYEYGVGAVAPEHLPEDQHITELQQAQDRIKFLEERLSFYEESEEGEIIGLRNLTEQYKQQITDYEEAAATNEEMVMAQLKTIGELKADLDDQKNMVSNLRIENSRLERQVLELKAEAYDLMKEKANLFKELFATYHDKEESK